LTLSIGVALGMLAQPPNGCDHNERRTCSVMWRGAGGFGRTGLITNPDPLRNILAFNCWEAAVSAVRFVSRRAPPLVSGAIQSLSDGHYRDCRCFAATPWLSAGAGLLQETGRATLSPIVLEAQIRTEATPDRPPSCPTRYDRWILLVLAIFAAAVFCCVRPCGGTLNNCFVLLRPVSSCVDHLRRRVRSGHADLHRGGLKPPLGMRCARRTSAAMM